MAITQRTTEQVFAILRDIADQGQTVVVVTHDPALVARADRRIHIVDGKIAEITAQGGGEGPARMPRTSPAHSTQAKTRSR